MTLLPMAPAQAVGLPSLLNSSAKQPEAQEPLGQSLDEVIKSLENDQQRTKLLADLKKLRDVTKKAQPITEVGVLGLIGGTLASFEKQFSGADSPLTRWSEEFKLAEDELTALVLPANEWLPIIFAFAMILMLWSLLAAALIWVSHRVRMRFGLTEELPQHPKALDMLRFALRKLGPWLIALVIGQKPGHGAGLCAGGRHLFLGNLRDRLFAARRSTPSPRLVHPAASSLSAAVADRQFRRLR
jgi:hypothetical protein